MGHSVLLQFPLSLKLFKNVLNSSTKKQKKEVTPRDLLQWKSDWVNEACETPIFVPWLRGHPCA
jgi:hypothetical protein